MRPAEPAYERLSARVTLALVFAAMLMVAAHAALVRQTIGLTHATAAAFAAVAPLIAWIALPAALGLVFASRLAGVKPTRVTLGIVLGAGLAMRLLWFTVPAPLEDDFNRYMWDGAVAARGLNPYTVPPQDFVKGTPLPGYERMRPLQTGPQSSTSNAVLKGINFPELRTIYPSVAQAGFVIAHWLAPMQINGLRAVFLGAELMTLLLLLRLLAATGQSPLWSALYWWNPLAAFSAIGIAHVDALVPPFVLGALLAALTQRFTFAASLLALGAGVKIWPVMLVPLVVAPLFSQPRRLLLAVLACGGVLAFAVGPLLLSTLQPNSGLAAYAAGWSNHNAFYAWMAAALTQLTGNAQAAPKMLRVGLVLATIAVALAATRYRLSRAVNDHDASATASELLTAALIVAAAVFYLSPAQFPWYALWFLPLAALARNWPLLLASATLPLYYLFFPLWEMGRGDLYFFGTSFLHAVPVLGWLLMDWMRRRRVEHTVRH